jgi:hypothetical protein
MNRLLIDQLARYIADVKYSTQTYYMSDIDQAAAGIDFFVSYLDQKLRIICLNAQENNNGICDLSWKHIDCRVLMEILFELTQDDKYKTTEWYL